MEFDEQYQNVWISFQKVKLQVSSLLLQQKIQPKQQIRLIFQKKAFSMTASLKLINTKMSNEKGVFNTGVQSNKLKEKKKMSLQIKIYLEKKNIKDFRNIFRIQIKFV
ncbi:unnamed protein product [Paramecium octaurelia]|uniref:Uncharacterized protein n=1 Tax=Paramecium octaurelia TaxID=43137 RepID=A0A8S1U9J0_PAROT|nr:unnamed protein product [Paramecium octaurelia]